MKVIRITSLSGSLPYNITICDTTNAQTPTPTNTLTVTPTLTSTPTPAVTVNPCN